MELVTGALPAVLSKLGELLVGEYNLQKEARSGIRFLQTELESIKGALEDVSKVPADNLKEVDKIWARDVRELSYDIEDSIDTFTVASDSETDKKHGFNWLVAMTLDKLIQPKIRHKFATEIRDIKRSVEEIYKRRDRYTITTDVAKSPVKIDPRLLVQHEAVTNLVGIDEAKDELIRSLMEGSVLSNQKKNIVSIVGFGGLGKTTLANVVYKELRPRFDCFAFISVSQTPDMKILLEDMMYQLSNRKSNGSINVVVNELREFLQEKRYFIVIDDIWDIEHWKTIKCALPDNDVGYKIITTTRNSNIAEKVGGAYNMRPLSLHNSRILLYRRIFSEDEDKDKCPNAELTEVTDRILEKCAGVPLAIITIASLLANKGKNKMEWYQVCNSIGSGMENSLDLENMRKILLLSYYELPSHLRTCLLYLSMFPEDDRVDKDRLIWMWIAEGFIERGTQGQSLFEVGESCLNELINRSMVQPKYSDDDDSLEMCHVHDMVLDVIRSLSREENFIFVWMNEADHTCSSKNVRRLSLQNGNADHAILRTDTSMQRVRSVVAFQSGVRIMSVVSSCRVLRVLDLKDCDLSESGGSLKYLGNLHQLRYLALGDTSEVGLPAEIGNLRLLQTLDLLNTKVTSLPLSILRLKHLMCLHTSYYTTTRVPKGIASLTSLEELHLFILDGDSAADTIKELGQLTELRLLDLFLNSRDESVGKHLGESINKLQKLRCLSIQFRGVRSNLDAWVVGSCHLRELSLHGCSFSRVADCINPSHLSNLSTLTITVRNQRQEDLEILGALPALRDLYVEVDNRENLVEAHERLVVGARLFPCLRRAELWGSIGSVVVFGQGAMPRLAGLHIPFWVRAAGEIVDVNDLGLGNLPSLRYIVVYLRSGGASKEEVEEARTALRHAAEIHPNRPLMEFWGGRALAT